MNPQMLVIGYGNTLRSDDGAGFRVAELIKHQQNPKIRALAVHQLTPELAEDISQARGVIFVDATLTESTGVTVQSLTSTSESGTLGHYADPRSLLNLTQMLYPVVPLAWWILIPGVNFGFGETFSEITEAGIKQALREIESLINS
jgi:hydrogenase maturation protease